MGWLWSSTFLGFYDELMASLPRETEEGTKTGAVGIQTVEKLIAGGLWKKYVDYGVGAEEADLIDSAGRDDKKWTFDTASAIASGKAGNFKVSNVALARAIKIWADELDKNENPPASANYLSPSIPTIAVLKNLTGIDIAALVKNESTPEKLKAGIRGDDGKIEGVVYDMLALNLLKSDQHAFILSRIDGTNLQNPDGIGGTVLDAIEEAGDFIEDVIDKEAQQLEEQIVAEEYQSALSGSATSPDRTEEEAISDIKFHVQTLLAANVAHFAKMSRDQRYKQKSEPADGSDGVLNCLKYNKTYMFDCAPSEVMNRLTYVPGSSQFIDITVPEVSSLMPMIRLEKIVYDSEGGKDDVIPILFSTFMNESDLRSQTSDLGRTGVGIKSFDWQYNGTNMAAVKSDITAKLVLYFQNFNDLLMQQTDGFKYVDLLVRTKPESPKEKEKDISDANTPNTAPQTADLADTRHFEIKATAGWAHNPDYADFVHGPHSALSAGIAAQRVSLFLTLVEHEFGISQDGTFELTINYRGRIDGLMMDKRADIILSEETRQKICALESKLAEAKKDCSTDDIEEVQEEIRLVKATAKNTSGADIMEKLLTTGKVYYISLSKEMLAEKNYRLAELSPADISGSAPNQLQQASEDVINQELAAQKEFLEKQQLVDENSGCDFDESWVGWSAQAAGTAIGTELPWYLQPGFGYLPDANKEVEVSTAEGTAADVWNCYAIAAAKAGGISAAGTPDETGGGDKIPGTFGLHEDSNNTMLVPYFFFGDLVDIVATKALGSEKYTTDEESCGGSWHPNRVDNLGIILGTMQLEPYGTQKQEEPINLADIPIALPYFKDWWHRHINKADATTYPLIRFIRDCIKDFVVDAVGGEVLHGRRPQKFLPKDASISIAAMQGGASPLEIRISQQIPQGYENTIRASRLNGTTVGAQSPLSPVNPSYLTPSDMYHYKVFYLVNETADSTLMGDKTSDSLKGIQHVVMGRDKGILKDAQFKRTTIKGLREQRVVDAGALDPLKHLADVYNITVRMIGNAIFYPGQLLFLNPIGFGTKLGLPQNPTSMSRAMGLGGYHLVTQVSSFIENGKFETTVEALWETSGGPDAPRANNGRQSDDPRCQGAGNNDILSSIMPSPESNISAVLPGEGGS